ncbi:UvrABC system protein C [Yersinia frederiksenii ATCC 33641]|nr:UvrABC system protein C [Yersinia frederiksenii ATCC 33641]
MPAFLEQHRNWEMAQNTRPFHALRHGEWLDADAYPRLGK